MGRLHDITIDFQYPEWSGEGGQRQGSERVRHGIARKCEMGQYLLPNGTALHVGSKKNLQIPVRI